MDSAGPISGIKRKYDRAVLYRAFVILAFLFFAMVSLFCAVGIFALSSSRLAITPRVSVPSQCKIVSSSVDLRTDKVCEIGLLNFKAKNVLYPSKRKKFRCHYDYYWASVFKVEYQDHSSGARLLGLAEAPKEALPSDCRPDFRVAFSTKNKFKVNESYDCWYTSGVSEVEIFQDNYFGCQVEDPSHMEMIRRYFILCQRMFESWWHKPAIPKGVGLGMFVGTILGSCMSMILINLLRILQALIFKTGLPQIRASLMAALARQVFLSRTFFFLAYFSLVGWLAIQYGKRLGLANIFVEF